METHITKLAKYHRFPQTPSIRSSHRVLNIMAQMTDIGVTWEDQDTNIQIPTPLETAYWTYMIQSIILGPHQSDYRP